MTTAQTPAQQKALDYARNEGKGRVYAGFNHTRRGMVVRVAASALRALERQGLVKCDQEMGSGQLFAELIAAPAPLEFDPDALDAITGPMPDWML